MGFLQFKVHFLFIQAFSILRTPFSYFRISSCLVFYFSKFDHCWYLWNLTSSPKLRLHANIFSFQVASSHSFSKCSRLKSTTFCMWSFFPHVVAVLLFQQVFIHTFFSFFPVNSSLQTFTTQVVGSKVLYTMKYYIHVERIHLTLHRPKFTHITQEKALFKKHLF